MRSNQLGGLQYDDADDQHRAKVSDLITLPAALPGTNCGNCIFFTQGSGFCRHAAVRLTVTNRMCCKFWKNQGQINSWENE
jgi:hypothetical protein